ncbi:MAG: transcription termination factor Rho [Actinobacteria bacterium]|nr:transcription termination factor Rho [Actinomycetota bacterium]
MTDTTSSLTAMKLPELKKLAGELGITGASAMRKGDLVGAISSSQGGSSTASAGKSRSKEQGAGQTSQKRDESPATQNDGADTGLAQREPRTRERNRENRDNNQSSGQTNGQQDRDNNQSSGQTSGQTSGQQNRDNSQSNASAEGGQREQGNRAGSQQNRDNRDSGSQQNRDNRGQQNRDSEDDRGNRRRRRGRDRFRDRERPAVGGRDDYDVAEDDVLLPVAGIVDMMDNYAFVRTSGYLPGSNDVYIALGLAKKMGLRKGDAVTGAVRQQRDGESRQKFNPLVRIDTINGLDPEKARDRVEFGKLTPLYPQDRLRLENDPTNLVTRVIDLVAPIGKGQRGLIVSPPKAGKTMVLQAIANAITANNPECHLMVVLVDERPEEVTDMQRSVKGEVIASTFDRPAEDHTIIAELAIERAKRLVEMGMDVVVLLDSMTRLGRAYNLAAPASGRILSGGVDSTALYPPKRFFGAARNIEHGGSLTILATALVETGSRMDEVIFEEFKGTGNMELKLDRRLADKRIFPAVDVDASGTRKEEILLSPDELKAVWKLRRVLHSLEGQQAIELLLNKLRETKTNGEFLMQVAKTTPGGEG